MKTIKDFTRTIPTPDELNYGDKYISDKELRESAIKDVKEFEKEDAIREKNEKNGDWTVVGETNQPIIEYIKEKFNITKEDLT